MAEPKIGELIDKLDANRNKRKALQKQLDPLEAEYKTLKAQILSKLEAEGQTKASARTASVGISEVTVPVVDDPSAAIKYLSRTGNLHILLAQPFSTPSWRELVGINGKDVPGTHTFIKRDLTHTSL